MVRAADVSSTQQLLAGRQGTAGANTGDVVFSSITQINNDVLKKQHCVVCQKQLALVWLHGSKKLRVPPAKTLLSLASDGERATTTT